MQKVFASRLKNDTFSFYEDDVCHLLTVLKIKLNEQIICIYEAKKYLCEIVSLNPLLAQIKQELSENNEFEYIKLSLFQAVIKPKHMEWILAKATELGINNIYSVNCERSQANNVLKQNRMEMIVQTAAKQSSRNVIPLVTEAIDFNDLKSKLVACDLLLVPFEKRENQNLGLVLEQLDLIPNHIGILVGPEGGFSQAEIDWLKNQANVKLVSLTKTILRSDTASFYTTSIVVDELLKRGY